MKSVSLIGIFAFFTCHSYHLFNFSIKTIPFQKKKNIILLRIIKKMTNRKKLIEHIKYFFFGNYWGRNSRFQLANFFQETISLHSLNKEVSE